MYVRTKTNIRRHPAAPSDRTAPVPDWSKLSRGDLVRVIRGDGRDLSGVIDMMALDRSVFWLIQDGGRGRVMVCSADKPSVVVLNSAAE